MDQARIWQGSAKDLATIEQGSDRDLAGMLQGYSCHFSKLEGPTAHESMDQLFCYLVFLKNVNT